jgi:hypothetical protein
VTRRDKANHVQLWLKPETRARLDALTARVPYMITVASIGERGFQLAIEELEKAFPNGAD